MPDIYIYDEFDPEALAMMQALYSRSPKSVKTHAERVISSGSSKFMESYYVGYGHASIGDCGTTTLFFEGVSILAAKAIQDNPLYSGQETSTRYIDFSKQPVFDPVNTDQTNEILNDWLSFYVSMTNELRNYLKIKFPLVNSQQKSTWEKAINARCFDILRGFLPAGSTTQLSWSTNLRQAYDKLSLLKFHPLTEVQGLALESIDALKAKYPSSFSHKERPDQDNYYKSNTFDINYSNYEIPQLSEEDFFVEHNISASDIQPCDMNTISDRPKWSRLPRHLTKYGRFNCKFLMDYGSFRDLQRHRNGLCRIPLLTNKFGFNSWYLEQIPSRFKNQAMSFVQSQLEKISYIKEKENISDTDLQYYLPMGSNVYCELVYDLPEMVYVTELRSSSTVHPTLRHIAHKLHNTLTEALPNICLYTDLSDDIFDIRRGLQDIEERKL